VLDDEIKITEQNVQQMNERFEHIQSQIDLSARNSPMSHRRANSFNKYKNKKSPNKAQFLSKNLT
jgi:hypothetical protein